MTRNDPHSGFRFRLEIDGINQAQFNECSGLVAEIDVIEYREGGEPTRVRKLAGLTKYGNVTLKWGVTSSMELYNWFRDAVNGDIQRRTVVIRLQDVAGDDVAAWEILQAWPCRMTGPTLNAVDGGVAMEELELCHEGWTRVR